MKLIWSGLADEKYWNYIAQYCLPSWNRLPGEKYVVSDSDLPNIDFAKVVKWKNIVNNNAKFLKLTDRLKPLNFWRKMQSQVWAIRNLTDCDFLILLDTDIEILDFNERIFFDYLKELSNSDFVWATGQSNRGGHDSGMIVLNTKHPELKTLTDHYENIWESGDIFKLDKWYDGHAVESMFATFPSIKIKNLDLGQGFHYYDFDVVHYGSKIPKEMRIHHTGSGKNLVEKKLDETPVKKLKSVQDQ